MVSYVEDDTNGRSSAEDQDLDDVGEYPSGQEHAILTKTVSICVATIARRETVLRSRVESHASFSIPFVREADGTEVLEVQLHLLPEMRYLLELDATPLAASDSLPQDDPISQQLGLSKSRIVLAWDPDTRARFGITDHWTPLAAERLAGAPVLPSSGDYQVIFGATGQGILKRLLRVNAVFRELILNSFDLELQVGKGLREIQNPSAKTLTDTMGWLGSYNIVKIGTWLPGPR